MGPAATYRRPALVGLLVVVCCWATGSALAAGPVEAPEPTIVRRAPADWYAMGGMVMHGLVACSVLGLALVLERTVALRRRATVPRALDDAIRGVVSGDTSPVDLKEALEPGRSSLARLAGHVLSAEATRASVESRGAAEVHRLQRNLNLLSAIGNLATMLGLFGTVLGMIEAFDTIAVAGTGDARVVAGGIFRALVTTAAGLGVGIAALAGHALLSRTADDRAAQLEARTGDLFAVLGSGRPGTFVEFDDRSRG